MSVCKDKASHSLRNERIFISGTLWSLAPCKPVVMSRTWGWPPRLALMTSLPNLCTNYLAVCWFIVIIIIPNSKFSGYLTLKMIFVVRIVPGLEALPSSTRCQAILYCLIIWTTYEKAIAETWWIDFSVHHAFVKDECSKSQPSQILHPLMLYSILMLLLKKNKLSIDLCCSFPGLGTYKNICKYFEWKKSLY